MLENQEVGYVYVVPSSKFERNVAISKGYLEYNSLDFGREMQWKVRTSTFGYNYVGRCTNKELGARYQLTSRKAFTLTSEEWLPTEHTRTHIYASRYQYSDASDTSFQIPTVFTISTTIIIHDTYTTITTLPS